MTAVTIDVDELKRILFIEIYDGGEYLINVDQDDLDEDAVNTLVDSIMTRVYMSGEKFQ